MARRAGGWRGRSAAAGATSPWAPPSARRSRYRPSRRRDRGWRSRRARAARPRAIAASTLRRASTDRLPWWMPIGSVSSLIVPQLLEDQLGEAARVAEDERGAVCARSAASRCGDRVIPNGRPTGCLFLGEQDRQVGLGAGIADRPGRPARYRRPARASRGSASGSPTVAESADAAQAGRDRCRRDIDSDSKSPRFSGGEARAPRRRRCVRRFSNSCEAIPDS